MKETRRFLVCWKKTDNPCLGVSMTTVTSLKELFGFQWKMFKGCTCRGVCLCVLVCVSVGGYICTCKLWSVSEKTGLHLSVFVWVQSVLGYPLLPGNSSHGNMLKQDLALLGNNWEDGVKFYEQQCNIERETYRIFCVLACWKMFVCFFKKVYQKWNMKA